MPTPDQRASVVRKDLDNVIHPIVAHKQLEQQQLVIVSAKDSTVVDADGREYLDGMAGLWCVNIGYGRTELADVAAEQMRQLSYYPHTAMNLPAAALAEKVNGLLGGVLAPPLVLTRAEIDRIVSVLDQTIPEICAEVAA